MTAPILLTGGTGTLGSLVTPLLRDAGAKVRILSRTAHQPADGIEYVTGDLRSGEGIDAAVAGAETIVHLAGGPKGDEEATRNLVRFASDSGVRHLVYISVIGAEDVPVGWVRSKLGAEQAIAESGLPYTTLRAAQFHELVLTMAQKMSKMPLVPAPGGLRFQPVDAGEVATRLVELAMGAPGGLVPDIAGPAVYPMAELIRSYLRAIGKRRPMVPMRIPGKAGRAYRTGRNLSIDGAVMGKRTWEDSLATHLRAA